MQKIHQLDGLRGWMSLWVWVTHGLTLASIGLHKGEGIGRILANGGTAVGVFILLSGFVVAMVLSRPDERRYSAWITRRFFRLFPVYLLALALSVWALDISITALTDNPWPSPRTQDRLQYLLASREHFWPHLLLHVGLLHGLAPESVLPHTSLAFIGQAWSLSLEWQFYLVVPFVIGWVLRRRPSLLSHGITVLALLGLAKLTPQDSFLGSHLYMFAIGAYTFAFMKSWQAGELGTRVWLAVMVFDAAAVLALNGGSKFLSVAIWFVTVLAMLQVGGDQPVYKAVNLFFNSRVSAFLGRISYSLYCLHMLVLFTFSFLLIRVVGVQVEWHYTVGLLALALPATIVLSWFVTTLFEEPMIAYGRRLVASRKLPATGLAEAK